MGHFLLFFGSAFVDVLSGHSTCMVAKVWKCEYSSRRNHYSSFCLWYSLPCSAPLPPPFSFSFWKKVAHNELLFILIFSVYGFKRYPTLFSLQHQCGITVPIHAVDPHRQQQPIRVSRHPFVENKFCFLKKEPQKPTN